VSAMLAGWPSCGRGPETRLGQTRRIPSCCREASLGCERQYGGWELSTVCTAAGVSSPHEGRGRCDDILLWPLLS
jgi:hypothetical protein